MANSTSSFARLRTQIGLVLLISGFCSLVYQVAWFRLLRLVFGASTSATAVVVAIFMGGLGFGGVLFGARVRRSPNPLAFYARLELGIALAALLSPWLIDLAGRLYVGLGGSSALGTVGATLTRLLLTVPILGIATTLMGGTLPAVAQAIENADDRGRRDRGRRGVAWLYGLNTLGAVIGAFATTFVFLELLGIRQALWVACLVNVLIALAARRLAQGLESLETVKAVPEEPERSQRSRLSSDARLLLPIAAAVGFLFFLMEIVWYRMLAPVLGGSSYTFGLILAVALLGIGVGGLVYSRGAAGRRPSWSALAWTCALEALCLALPFAAGDDLALFAAITRQLAAVGFSGLVLSWLMVASLVVLPASLVAGYQFPLLVALVGEERERVGYEVGLVYAWNTWGAILGSLAGGLGLLPLFGAPRLWWLSAVALLAVAAVAAAVALARGRRRGSLFGAGMVALAAGLLCLAPGPSAFWRHMPIGAGRAEASYRGPNEYRSEVSGVQRAVVAEAEGIESNVALVARDDLALYVNGKSDGAARGDAGTVVMSGLVGAALHPRPQRALVIGLGTGMTAGWLAAVDSIERVDVVELEPAVIDFARRFEPVNHSAMDSPKIQLHEGDGREFVLTGSERYDVIFSEPSNPYRAGVADLFSRDFYRAVAQRLAPKGIFLQWLQGYEVDAQVIETAFATLGSVFGSVETWQVDRADLLLVATVEPIVHDMARLREVVAREPWRSALRQTWRVEGLEGFYTGFVADGRLARELARISGADPSTDDHPRIEFGFARSVGRSGVLDLQELQRLARELGVDRVPGPDWVVVDALRHLRAVDGTFAYDRSLAPTIANDDGQRRAAREAYAAGSSEVAAQQWLAQGEMPEQPFDLLLLAEGLASQGDARVEPLLAALRESAPTEAAAIESLLRWRRGEDAAGAAALLETFERAQTDGWVYLPLLERTLEESLTLAPRSPEIGARIFESLGVPFAVELLGEARLRARIRLAARLGFERFCVPAFEAIEPDVIWDRAFLEARSACYDRTDHPLADVARKELGDFLSEAAPSLGLGLRRPEVFDGQQQP